MSLSIESHQTSAMSNDASLLSVSNTGIPNDSQLFHMHSIISDFELSITLFASCGDILLVCGRGKEEKNSYFLCSYEIPSVIVSSTSKQCLRKIIQLAKKSVGQLEVIPKMKLVLVLGDGVISVFDIGSLTEICTVANNAVLFTTSYDIPSNTSTLPLSAQPSSNPPVILRLCVVSQNHQLTFFRCVSPQRHFEKENNLPDAFELFDIPYAIAVSRDRICVAYEKSYVILNLTTGMIIYEITVTKKYIPSISCIQEQTQWCIQRDTTTIFLDSNFEPLYKDGIVWGDIPTAIVPATSYVLALMNQSVDICVFNGTKSIPVQRIELNESLKMDKYRLWRDIQTNRIYLATSDALYVLEPVPVHSQIQKFIATYRCDFALSIIRAALNISTSSPNNDQPRTIDGHAKGNLDLLRLPRVTTFVYNKQGPTELSSNTLIPQNSMDNLSPSLEIWYDYYRVGTIDAFQLFHQEQFEQAFVEFHEFLTDPADIISLFPPIAANIWLTNSYCSLANFVQQYPHFSAPKDFTGVKLQKALRELQYHLTELRRVFQTIYHRSPDAWLEVQSLVQNGLILRPIRDLLTIIETALFKIYFINNSYTLIGALLRNDDHFCLPWEVETALTKHDRPTELILFYRRQDRHRDALQLIMNTKSMAFIDRVLDYLSKLDNNHLSLVFQYVQPIIITALQQNNDQLLHEIVILFIEESTQKSSSTEQSIMRFDPNAVYDFLKDLNENLTIRYLQRVLSVLWANPSVSRRIPGDGPGSIHWCQHLELSDKLKRLTHAKQLNHHHVQHSAVQDKKSVLDQHNRPKVQEPEQFTHPTTDPQHISHLRSAPPVNVDMPPQNNTPIHQHVIPPNHALPVQPQILHVPSRPIPSITVCHGGLATEKIDVIVVCSSSHYLFEAICRAGGNAIRASYIAESKNQPDGSIVAVKAEGQLASKRVYFLPWKVHFDKGLLQKSVKTFVANAITRAVQEGYYSIAFPAIGCGQVGCSVTLVAQSMVEEAHQLSHKHGMSVLFVIEPQRADVYQEFQKEINSRPPSSVMSTMPTKIVSLPVNKGVIEVELGDLVTQKVDAIIVNSSSQFLMNTILKAAGNQTEMAYNTEQKSNPNAKLISTSAGALPSKRIFFVKWQPDKDDAKLTQSLIDLILTVIHSAMAYKLTSLAFPAIGCGKYGCPVDTIVKTLVKGMEHQLSTKDLHLTVKFVIHSDQQAIYDAFCKQVLKKQEGDVSRSMNYQPPATWEKSQNNKIRFPLSKTSYEYKLIATNFEQSMKGKYFEIVQIERIQNERWYVQYIAHSHSFQARLHKNTERSLYHGCPESAADLILKDCFNRSYAGVNGIMHGIGVYFSSDPAYSHTYTKSNSRGERHMFLARVLIGNTTIGNSSMKTPPVGCDSTTDGRHIFVTFHDAQAYAEYLIIYK